MRIAIIDDGIDQNCNIYNKDIYYFSIRNGRFEECKKQGEYAILSHGTIASLIFTYFTQKMDYELYSLKIVDVNTQTATIEYLISAIQWCIQEKIDMILMSLGSTEYSDFEGLQKVLRIAAENEILMIAAYSNDNILTYPAASEYVIGVKYDSLQTLHKGKYFIYSQNDENINVIVNSRSLTMEKELQLKVEYSNSYAVPYLAARIILLDKGKKVKRTDVFKALYENMEMDLGIDTYLYFKRSIAGWEEKIESPIIGFPQEEKIFSQLVKTFESCGYRVVEIVGTESSLRWNKINVKSLLKKYPRKDLELLKLIYNIYKPDIIFMEDNILEYKEIIDLKVSSTLRNGYMCIGQDVNEMREKIENIFE